MLLLNWVSSSAMVARTGRRGQGTAFLGCLTGWLVLASFLMWPLAATAQLEDPKHRPAAHAHTDAKPTKMVAPPRKYRNAPAKAVKAYEHAMEFYDAREFEKAEREFADLNKKYPSFPEPWFRRGSIQASTARKREAYESFKHGITALGFDAAYAPEYLVAGDLALEFGDYETARMGYAALLKANPRNKRGLPQAEKGVQICDFAAQQLANPATINPQPLPAHINQFRFHYFPAVTADGRALLFTARKGTADTDDENLYLARRRATGEFDAPQSISPLINSPYNEGAATISGDGKTLVFTSCYRSDSRGDCDLYFSRRENGAWTKPVNLGPNVNSTWWDSQPTLSADGRTLYFSSARKSGSVGQEDIYVTTLGDDDATWSVAKNLGAPVNTTGRDMAPFLHPSGTTLYYVTDGPVGMGGLDLFRSERKTGGAWGAPQNLGYPLNTFEDESSVFITTDNRTGFYSRKQTATATEPMTIRLYQFDVPKAARSFEQSAVAQGRVFDAVTKKNLAATVQVYDIGTDELVESVRSDKEDGEYTVVLTEGHQYAMYAAADDYLMKSLTFDYTDRKSFDPLTLDIGLDPVKTGASIVLNNLFFPTNSFELEKKSKTELNRLKRFMNQYPTISVEISGHTDDVGSDAANLTLSDNRAKAVYDYLVNAGVKADRLTFKGYGETQPAVANSSDANRRLNRRIELRIL